MELHQYARQVLFSTSLDEKLAVPPELTDNDSTAQTPLGKVSLPGRPAALAFGNRKAGKFPKQSSLHEATSRAAVLHYFANHELLALELMALALLRFPGAPGGFRRGIAETMREEVAHLQLYRERMQELGLGFGDIAVSQFFWNTMAGMRSPLEYTAQMSLTFEQANLDYSLHYQKMFADVGDEISAAIMHRVYEEEIGHVKHGAVWFDRLRPKEASHWEEFADALTPPLTPRRARGIGFDRKGRERAGIPEDSIARLEIFNASKGRPGRLFWFNPDCEKQIGFGQKGGPTQRYIRDFAKEYAPIMAFLGTADDALLLPEVPPVEFCKRWQRFGFALPEMVALQTHRSATKVVKGRVFDTFRPWGWDPNTVAMGQTLAQRMLRQQDSEWLKGDADSWRGTPGARAFSKSQALQWRRDFYKTLSVGNVLVPGDLEFVCDSLARTEYAIDRVKEAYHTVCVKGIYGSSGQNSIRLRSDELLSQNIRDWISRNCRLQGGVVVEAWLQRVFDFGLQIDCSKPAHPLLGWTRFVTTARGQHKAHVLGGHWWQTEETLRRFMYRDAKWDDLLDRLASFVCEKLRASGYEGPAGIDGFVASTSVEPTSFKLRPLIEVNPRFTMGHVALQLEKRLCSNGEPALWWHVSASDLRDLSCANFEELLAGMQPELENELLTTNPVGQARTSLGVVIRGEADMDTWLKRLNAREMI